MTKEDEERMKSEAFLADMMAVEETPQPTLVEMATEIIGALESQVLEFTQLRDYIEDNEEALPQVAKDSLFRSLTQAYNHSLIYNNQKQR